MLFYLITQCLSVCKDETSGIPGFQPATQPLEGVYLPHEPCDVEPSPNECVNALKSLSDPGLHQRELGCVPHSLKLLEGRVQSLDKVTILKFTTSIY